MPGEEETPTKLGSSSSATHLAASTVLTSNNKNSNKNKNNSTIIPTTLTAASSSVETTPPPNVVNNIKSPTVGPSGGGGGGGSSSGVNSRPPPSSSKIKHQHSKDGGGCGDATDSEEDRSKLELEVQFAGIDDETAELDLDEDENPVDTSNGGGNSAKTPEASPIVGSPVVGEHSSLGGPSGSTSGMPGMVTSERGSVSSRVGGGAGGSVGGMAPTNPLDEEEDEDVEGGKTVECTEVIVPIQTLAEKCLFYITAFFILLAVFSLFAFLFLVPFVIDPAFTTIFMEFDPEPAFCFTVSNVKLTGSSNCNWTSCREGCTRETFSCTQIRVNYRRAKGPHLNADDPPSSSSSGSGSSGGGFPPPGSSSNSANSNRNSNKNHHQPHVTNGHSSSGGSSSSSNKKRKHGKWSSAAGSSGSSGELTRAADNSDPYWDYKGAHLFPNVKGCGYPPVVVCSDFFEKYGTLGTNFSCFYSKVDRGLVVTKYDMSRVIVDLIYSMAIPIPSFIISVVYLIFAYFRIYSTDSSADRRGGLNPSATNNNIGGGGGTENGDADADTSLSLTDDKTKILAKSTSGRLNAVTDKLVANSGKGHSQVIEMNDLNPSLHHNPQDGDLLLPRRNNNRAPERNGPANPAAKNKGGESGGSGDIEGGGGPSSLETSKYLEPGVLPEKSNALPPIQLPQPPSDPVSRDDNTLEEEDDDSHLNSEWADSSSMKRSFQGLRDVSWKPK